MRRNTLVYLIAFTLLVTVFLFFVKAYRDLIQYTQLTQRHNVVYHCFQSLSEQINNAAINNSALTDARKFLNVSDLFYVDSLSVTRQLNLLKSAVRDSINISIASKLDTRIKAEISWLLKSNVPDSITKHKALTHIRSLQSIDSLIAQGIKRTSFLIEVRKIQVDESISNIIKGVVAFIILSALVLIYTAVNWIWQKTTMQRSEERFRSLIENSYDIVAILDETFRPIYRSPSSARITGYGNEERDTIGGGTEQTHPDDREAVIKAMKVVLENPTVPFPLRYRIRHKDGHYLLIDGMITNMLHNDAIKGIIANFRDVTEIQKAEQKLVESERIYRIIASSIPGSVISLFDKEYRYLLVEGDMIEAFGYSKQKLLGNKIKDVVSQEHYEMVLPQFKRVFEGETFMNESSRPGFDTVSRFVPLRDESNNVFAAMVVVIDISELKKTQRAMSDLNTGLERKINERTRELEVANKELESFSYSVAHDLRTPLRAVYGYALMLEEDYGIRLDPEGKRLIDAVSRNAKQMGTLIDDLLSFSQLGRRQIQKSQVDMKKITESSFRDITLDGGYNGQITINNLHGVMADSSLMKHIMINLLGNAIKYSSKKEMPVIEVSSTKENDEVIYTIKDNGVGFDMAYAGKLFGVFQRLHSDEEFEGTGVGLAIVQRIIHRHSGRIWAESEVDQGASFHFSLPALSKTEKEPVGSIVSQ